MIWLSTANGIVGLSGEDPKVLELINGSNLIGNQYSYGAVCSTSSGILYWGNTDGMISLVPSKIRNRTVHEKVIITDILARDSEHSFSLCAEGTSAMVTDKVEVSHKNAASIHISFVSPEFTDRNPLYSYKISRGKDDGFSGMTYDNSVTFTGLRAGKYRFEVSIAGKQDIPECNRSLEIHIQPHPMLSSTAFIMYALFSIAIIATLVLLYELKRKRDKARHLTKITIKKEKEIFNAKINFFTNITHEIRTPLTLIKMPIDKIISSGAYNASNEKDLRIIQANTDRLLNLTNQLLDMRKMENNEISVSFVKEDLCMIVKKALMLFEQMASEQHMKLTSEIPDSPVYAMCAKDSVFSIMSNLISNAVKYGNGQIIVKISYTEDQQSVIIRVNSDGEIIPKQDRENIFKLFFQREGAEKGVHGTGLGLPYARTLANMHNGRLYLDDSVKDMNSFVLELPVKQAEQIIMEQPVVDSETDLPVFDSSRHTILIVEDSAEMRKYLAKEISAEYNVKLAANGKDALEILKKEKIDLVISDIMMPIMDGCELCNIIKTDSDLSHVPIILLTAAVGVETRIETLESGADGYIEKPFPMELLMSNINNLFRNKEISYKQFISKPLTHYNSVTTNKVDQNYMDKVHEFIMKHISEPDLNIESLTMEIGTSKSSLYRKLKANTGLSINEYIRLCRLKQAAELLSSQKYKINEVAFMTGFSSPSYFATCFLKQFNLTPSEFVKNLGE
jgi:signal transduction histidine kinase/DNA-binding response OmpR family regulator